MHPASRILIYLVAALVIPGLSFFWGGVLGLIAVGAMMMAYRQPWRLLWRTRWLMLVLVLGYGYTVPGDAVWHVLHSWSPSLQGLAHGAERVFRLTVLLLWLDWLVLRMNPENLLTGLFALMKPLRLLGVDATPVALRLALTLKAVEALERQPAEQRGALRGLLAPMESQQARANVLPERIVLNAYPLKLVDRLLPVLMLAIAAGIGWQGISA